jgi:hypothetical protein
LLLLLQCHGCQQALRQPHELLLCNIASYAVSCCCSGMVASWVSQASFEPLGLTISVAKDRAIESMMQVRGAAVVLV